MLAGIFAGDIYLVDIRSEWNVFLFWQNLVLHFQSSPTVVRCCFFLKLWSEVGGCLIRFKRVVIRSGVAYRVKEQSNKLMEIQFERFHVCYFCVAFRAILLFYFLCEICMMIWWFGWNLSDTLLTKHLKRLDSFDFIMASATVGSWMEDFQPSHQGEDNRYSFNLCWDDFSYVLRSNFLSRLFFTFS